MWQVGNGVNMAEHVVISLMGHAAVNTVWHTRQAAHSVQVLTGHCISPLGAEGCPTPHSLAMAFARAVLPQPGGPCSNTPRGGSTPSHPYTCGQTGRRKQHRNGCHSHTRQIVSCSLARLRRICSSATPAPSTASNLFTAGAPLGASAGTQSARGCRPGWARCLPGRHM